MKRDDFVIKRSASTKFTKEPRLRSKLDLRPGPLDYNVEFSNTIKSTPKFTIGKALRPYTSKGTRSSSSPTPLSYSPDHRTVLLNAPRATVGFAKRILSDECTLETPGPGKYDLNRKPAGPKVINSCFNAFCSM